LVTQITAIMHAVGASVPTILATRFPTIFTPFLEQVHEHVAPLGTVPHPVPQQIPQISITHITVAPFELLGCGWRGHGGEQRR
jgi:hypothetical protein